LFARLGRSSALLFATREIFLGSSLQIGFGKRSGMTGQFFA
jgi:hypothetical protein